MKDEPYEYFRKLNTYLRQKDYRILPYIPMLKLHTVALKQLVPVPPCQVYRGVKHQGTAQGERLRAAYGAEDFSITWHAFTSATKTMKVVEGFMGPEGERTLFLLSVRSGFDLKRYSLHPEQDEVLLPAGLRFKVTGMLYAGGGLTIIHLQEMEDSPDCILNYQPPNALPAPARLPAPKPRLNAFFVSRCVGPNPKDRTWRDEWRQAFTEDRKIHIEREGISLHLPDDESLQPGGSDSIEAKLEKKAKDVEWKLQNGWEREMAEGFTLLTSHVTEPLARALREGQNSQSPCTVYAASTHFVCDAFAWAARSVSQPAPKCYANLEGKFGLADQFEEWRILLDKGRGRKGTSFLTTGVTTAYHDPTHFDAALSGGTPGTFAVRDVKEGQVRWVAQEESDVIEIVSEAQEYLGHHTLIQVTEKGGFKLPPMATVTVEDVKEPGEWMAHGVKGARRLFVCKVLFEVERDVFKI